MGKQEYLHKTGYQFLKMNDYSLLQKMYIRYNFLDMMQF